MDVFWPMIYKLVSGPVVTKKIYNVVHTLISFILFNCKTFVKQPLKNRQNKDLNDNCSLMKVESIAECSKGAFCNTFDLH